MQRLVAKTEGIFRNLIFGETAYFAAFKLFYFYFKLIKFFDFEIRPKPGKFSKFETLSLFSTSIFSNFNRIPQDFSKFDLMISCLMSERVISVVWLISCPIKKVFVWNLNLGAPEPMSAQHFLWRLTLPLVNF